MAKINLQHLQYESDGWKRLLEFTKAENGFLLSRLSAIAKQNGEATFITNAEYFQNLFVEQDARIRNLRDAIEDFDKLLMVEWYVDGKLAGKTGRQYKQLKEQVELEDQEFRNLKSRFDSYISTV